MIVNQIMTGPLYNILNLALGESGDIREESIAEACDLGERIAEEGFVLLKNDGILPLDGETKLNTFGWSATNPVYGGTGSGSLSGLYDTVSLLSSLENAGIQYNKELTDFYTGWRSERPVVAMFGQDWTVPEPAMDEYDAAGIFENAKAYSDTAMIVISRSGGEGADLPMDLDPANDTYSEGEGMGGVFGSATGMRMSEYPEDAVPGKHYLELSTRERAMVERVAGEFDHVVVVINAANAMELGWVDEFPSIEAVILAPGPGQTGFTALGKILTGEINPSGKTIDTYVYDLTATPTIRNFGDFTYTNTPEFEVAAGMFNPQTQPNFVNYVEGIYVGYRYYETAAAENKIDYDATVQYPFGYGLSYTTFEQKMGDITDQNGTLSFDVTVTNTGKAAGKSIVQVYYNPPYTSGGIEKASANLVAFAKTGIIEPGQSESVPISFRAADMASFDSNGAGCYVLEQGDYTVSINENAHDIIDSRVYNVAGTVTYGEGNPREGDKKAANVQFGYAEGDVTYLSRADGFANFDAATAAPASLEMNDEAKAGFYNNSNYDPFAYNNSEDVMPTTGKNSGMKLRELRGADYDDPKWETLLDQLTIEEMVSMISSGGYQSMAVPSIGKTQQVDCDGPASINNNFTGKASIGFPAGVVISASWNTDLAQAFGSSIGKMGSEMGVSGWYAPAMNIHRSAFAGRNFEYYSEDGLISGKMASNAIQGASQHGMYSFMKHFALNDQETNRFQMLCTWSNEQAIREIYLKPFELCVKEGNCTAAMSALNYIGNKPTAACNELLNTVLRDEWGFHGMVLTDYFGGYGYQDADRLIRNGNDFCLAPNPLPESVLDD